MISTTNVDDIIKSKFLSPEKFALDIERFVLENKCDYIEGIVSYCEINSIELETVSKLVSKTLKEKLKNNAMHLNFLKTSNKTKSVV